MQLRQKPQEFYCHGGWSACPTLPLADSRPVYRQLSGQLRLCHAQPLPHPFHLPGIHDVNEVNLYHFSSQAFSVPSPRLSCNLASMITESATGRELCHHLLGTRPPAVLAASPGGTPFPDPSRTFHGPPEALSLNSRARSAPLPDCCRRPRRVGGVSPLHPGEAREVRGRYAVPLVLRLPRFLTPDGKPRFHKAIRGRSARRRAVVPGCRHLPSQISSGVDDGRRGRHSQEKHSGLAELQRGKKSIPGRLGSIFPRVELFYISLCTL